MKKIKTISESVWTCCGNRGFYYAIQKRTASSPNWKRGYNALQK
jgi:hypothetical protein